MNTMFTAFSCQWETPLGLSIRLELGTKSVCWKLLLQVVMAQHRSYCFNCIFILIILFNGNNSKVQNTDIIVCLSLNVTKLSEIHSHYFLWYNAETWDHSGHHLMTAIVTKKIRQQMIYRIISQPGAQYKVTLKSAN